MRIGWLHADNNNANESRLMNKSVLSQYSLLRFSFISAVELSEKLFRCIIVRQKELSNLLEILHGRFFCDHIFLFLVVFLMCKYFEWKKKMFKNEIKFSWKSASNFNNIKYLHEDTYDFRVLRKYLLEVFIWTFPVGCVNW